MATAFARIRWVKCQGDKTLFGQRLGIQAAGLLFYCAEGTAHGNSCQFAFTAILRQVEIAN